MNDADAADRARGPDTPVSVVAFLGFEPPAGQAEALAEALPDLRRLIAVVTASDPR